MKRSIRCLSLVPALAIVALPAIASAATPSVSWSKDFPLFDTNNLGAQQALSVINLVPSLDLKARAAADLELDGGMNATAAWFEALGTSTFNLTANKPAISLDAAPYIDAYAEFITGKGEQNAYRVEISYTDFSGNEAYIVPPTSSFNPLSYSGTPTIVLPATPQQVGISLPIVGAVDEQSLLTAYVFGSAQASVDPVHGIVVDAATSLDSSFIAYAGASILGITYTMSGGITFVDNEPAEGYAANASVSGSVVPATEPSTGDLGFCLNAQGSWGLEKAMAASFASNTGLPSESFAGVGPGNDLSLGSVSACWSPADGGTWNTTPGAIPGAWYGTLALATLLTPSCTTAPSCTGILGGPPDLVITCAESVTFEGNGSTLATGTTYTAPMSDYAGTVQACLNGQCEGFSTYSPTTSWCPGGSGGSSSGGSSGGGSSGGKGGCHGTTCQ